MGMIVGLLCHRKIVKTGAAGWAEAGGVLDLGAFYRWWVTDLSRRSGGLLIMNRQQGWLYLESSETNHLYEYNPKLNLRAG